MPRWTYTRTKLETADRAKENLKPTAFSSTRSPHSVSFEDQRMALSASLAPIASASCDD
jgi:hypothetical protein